MITTGSTQHAYHRFNYGRQVIYLGLLFFNLSKAIEYGDGERETLCLKFATSIFRSLGHHKYSYLMVKRQIQLLSVFSEAEAYEFINNTTVGEKFSKIYDW